MLSNENVDEFLESLGETGETLRYIASLETWTIDEDADIYSILIDISNLMPSSPVDDTGGASKVSIEQWICFLSSIALPRFILSLQWIMNVSGHEVLEEIKNFEPTDEQQSIDQFNVMSRLDELIKLQLLSSVLSKSRMEKIINILNDQYDH